MMFEWHTSAWGGWYFTLAGADFSLGCVNHELRNLAFNARVYGRQSRLHLQHDDIAATGFATADEARVWAEQAWLQRFLEDLP